MTTAAPALTRKQVVTWRNSVFLVFLLPGLSMGSWVSRLPATRDALELGPALVGVLVFGVAAGAVTGLTASGHIVARLGSRTTIGWGIVATAVALATVGVGATVASFPVTIIGLALFGCASGITDVAMNVNGAANEQALGRTIMPVFHAFFSVGTMIGAGLGVVAESLRLPIALHLGVVSAIILVGLVFARRGLQPELVFDDEPAAEKVSGWRARLGIWRDRRTLIIGVLVLGAAFAEGTANDWLAIAVVDGHGVDNATGALVFGIFVTAMTIGRLSGIFVIDRFGRVPVLRGSFLLAGLGLVILIFVPNPTIAIAGAALWGLGAALGFPVGMSAAADDPRTAAARVSAVATIGYIAFLAGPPIIGFLGERTGVLHALLVVLALCAVGIVVAGGARELPGPPEPPRT